MLVGRELTTRTLLAAAGGPSVSLWRTGSVSRFASTPSDGRSKTEGSGDKVPHTKTTRREKTKRGGALLSRLPTRPKTGGKSKRSLIRQNSFSCREASSTPGFRIKKR